MTKNKILYHTVEHSPVRKILVEASKQRLKKIFNISNIKNIKDIRVKYSKIPSFRFILFFIKNILNLNILIEKKYVQIRYNGYEIGRYAASYTYRDNKVFSYQLLKNYLFIKNIIIAGFVVDNALKIVKKSSAIYIDHVGYLNGLYINIFSQNKKIIFFNGFPRGFSFIDFKKKRNQQVNDSTIIIVRESKNKIDKNIIKKCKKKIVGIIKQPKKNLHYMRFTQYSKKQLNRIEKIDFKKANYLIYAHSFVDGQLFFGYDGFTNLFEWLDFTINNLKMRNKNVIVKAHPNFYNKILANLAIEDKKIFDYFKNKYQSKKIQFIDIPVENNLILKKLDKKTIILSHHGTAILESTYMGFKSICSYAAIWSKEFKISNQWSSKKEYKKLLTRDYSSLKLYNSKNKFYDLLHQMYFNPHSVHKKKHFYTIIKKNAKNVKITKKMYKINADNIMKYVDIKKIPKITNEISNNVEEIII